MAKQLTSFEAEAALQLKKKIKFLQAGRRTSAVQAEIAVFAAEYAALTGEAA